MNKTIAIIIAVVVLILIIVGVVILRPDPAPTTENNTTTTTSTEPTATTATWKATGTAVAGSFADADTVKLAANSYRMYYATQPEVPGNNHEIYSATSTDGINWTKEAGERKRMATFPEVIKLADGTFRMYFQGSAVIKSATSTDGLSWTDETGTRVDSVNDLGLTLDNVAAPTVMLMADGTYLMVYRGTINEQYPGEVTPNKFMQLLFYATSPDGLTWTKKGLAIDTRVVPLYGIGDGPELFTWEDGSIKLSFWTYTGVYWSTVTAGSTFSTPEKVFALTESTPMNKFPGLTAGDPVYAEFNNIWYMYYGQRTGIDYAVGTLK